MGLGSPDGSCCPLYHERWQVDLASKSEGSSSEVREEAPSHSSQALLLRLQERGRKRVPSCPLPRTYCLPGLGQKAVILFLQALGQALQVLQLLIHSLGKLQSLLGTEWGQGQVGHESEEGRNHTDRVSQQDRSNREIPDRHPEMRETEARERETGTQKKRGKEPSTGEQLST